jgi:RimJ/RimL family protein N-acetyltransferase
MSQPTLKSKRLILRPFRMADASTIQRLAGDRLIADTTLSIPHPYEDGMAEKWIQTHRSDFESGTFAIFAIVVCEGEQLIGAISLQINRDINKGELGYWVGKPYWNLGYATEATITMLDWAFNALDLNRVSAKHFARNPSSGRVMEKAGMRLEGTARQDTLKWGAYEDLVRYGVVREDWVSR